jgi:hypothetical protein
LRQNHELTGQLHLFPFLPPGFVRIDGKRSEAASSPEIMNQLSLGTDRHA